MRWVVDGDYTGQLGDLVLERADLVVWLDLPLRVTLPRLWSRTRRRMREQTELWGGNRETWRDVLFSRDSLFVYTLRTHRGKRRRYTSSAWPATRCVRLTSPLARSRTGSTSAVLTDESQPLRSQP